MTIGLGLLGCGTVGAEVVRLVARHQSDIAARVGAPVRVVSAAVRDLTKVRADIGDVTLTSDPYEVVRNPDVHVVVELMGGLSPARELIREALALGKQVVTANKMLLAHEGDALFALARERSCDLAFEGAVGGGIPMVRTLRDALVGDRIVRIVAILNGTSNYILTRMQLEGLSFAEVLSDAQKLGYAEADPSLDVDGHDAAHKLVVLSALAFGAGVNHEAVFTEGLRSLEPIDHTSADRLGYVVKPLAVAERGDNALAMRVGPTLVPKSEVLASVSGVLNALLLEGEALGPLLLSGRGAGGGPTAVSVLADVVEVCRAKRAGKCGLLAEAVRTQPVDLRPIGEARSAYYLRAVVRDEAGVLGQITTALGRHAVSIRELVQRGRTTSDAVDIVMLTHEARHEDLVRAFAEIDAQAFVLEPTRMYPLLAQRG